MNLPEFYDLLEAHDWTYAYSDDQSYWERGQAEADKINAIADDDDSCCALLDKYNAYVWRGAPKPERPTAE